MEHCIEEATYESRICHAGPAAGRRPLRLGEEHRHLRRYRPRATRFVETFAVRRRPARRTATRTSSRPSSRRSRTAPSCTWPPSAARARRGWWPTRSTRSRCTQPEPIVRHPGQAAGRAARARRRRGCARRCAKGQERTFDFDEDEVKQMAEAMPEAPASDGDAASLMASPFVQRTRQADGARRTPTAPGRARRDEKLLEPYIITAEQRRATAASSAIPIRRRCGGWSCSTTPSACPSSARPASWCRR